MSTSAPEAPEGQLPVSTALAEASPESLSELMSINPEWEEKFRAALPRIVEALREMRRRFALSETDKATKPKAAKAPKALSEALKAIPKAENVDIDF